jgi:hypothetical protein
VLLREVFPADAGSGGGPPAALSGREMHRCDTEKSMIVVLARSTEDRQTRSEEQDEPAHRRLCDWIQINKGSTTDGLNTHRHP